MATLGPRHAAAAALAAVLAGCGGGGGGGTTTSPPPAAPGALVDTTPYSSAAGAALSAPAENLSTTSHTLALGGTTIAYTASAGHLNARDPNSGADEAALFYVAYSVPGADPATRPLVFFFNGGPGSATVWLHLGSYAPRRVVTADPSLAIPLPFQLVDNAESLIDVADLVFVDAVGTGYSEAIAPLVNQSFWGVDRDAAVMRDFIARYVAVNHRGASPTFLFGESYGTTRAAVLAELMLGAGMRLDGVVLQSSILDYHSNCDVFAADAVSCAGFVPSYGEVGAWYRLTQPVPSDADAYAGQLRSFTDASYASAAAAFVLSRQAPPAGLVNQLVALTGAPASLWSADLDLEPTPFRRFVLPGQLMGRYDARVVVAAGNPLAAGGDPSAAIITAPFTAAAQQLFNAELLYAASAPYTLLSDAISSWNYSHDGLALPDTIPDLAAALTRQPGLRILSLAGYHDLATPFRQTEFDLARLGAQPTIATRVYSGGHMTYLDDGSRVRLRAAITAFVRGTPIPASSEAGASLAAPAIATAPSRSAPSAATPNAVSGALETIERGSLAQGGDPYLPPALRLPAAAPSPRGAALAALVRAKIAARDRDPYR